MERRDRAARCRELSSDHRPQALRDRMDSVVASGFLVALALVQAPGWTAADTKLDLAVNPGGFLRRSLSLWDPNGAAGQLQNQAYGYLFPMGPFFWVGHELGLPAWVVQRLWWALLLLVAWHGMHRLLVRLGVGGRASRLMAAFAYALAPRMFMGLGAISSELWPMAVAPWLVLPLVAVPPGGERRAALHSGVAALCLGAVNAVASLAVLILPAWWILTRSGRVRWRLLGWWTFSVGLACTWWIGPLLLLSRFSPPFLDWIEDARVTTSSASLPEALRGTTQWIASLGGQSNAVWPAGWATVADRNAILFGMVLGVIALVGLAHVTAPWAGFARGALILGLVCVTAGHIGGISPPWAGALADLMDGPLAPFRNSHKFEPVVRLPLALGLAHAIPVTRRWLSRRGAPWPRMALVVPALAIVGQVSVPAFIGVIQRGPFLAVPAAWPEAAAWLAAHPDAGRTLVLPGGNASARVWGEPKDEPLQPFAQTPWMVRDGVPLGSAGATRILDEIESLVAQGHSGPELPQLLGQLGVTRVLLAGDVQVFGARKTPPLVARAALVEAGARPVASFGGFVNGSSDPTVVWDWGLNRPLREVEILEIDTGASIKPERSVVASAVGAFAGGPEGAARVSTAPLIHVSDVTGALQVSGPILTSDTLQRRQNNFSSVTDGYGPLLTASEDYPSARRVHDYWPPPLDEDLGSLTDEQTVRLDSPQARAVASSSLAQPALGQGRELDSDAWRAFDSSGLTAWRSAGYEPVGEWVQLDWATPLTLPREVEVVLDASEGADVAAVSVRTERGSVRTPVTAPALVKDADPSRYTFLVQVPAGATRSLRLTIEAVRDRRPTVRVLDIGAGVLPRADPSVRLPLTGGSAATISLMASADAHSPCHELSSDVVACSPDRERTGEETGSLRREFTLDRARSFTVSGTAIPQGVAVDRLLERLDGVSAEASSRWFDLPAVSPQLLVDGDPKTYWAADPAERAPTLELSWPSPRRVEGLRIETDPDVGGRRPTEVEVTVDGQTYQRAVQRDGSIDLPVVTVDNVALRVTATTTQDTLTVAGRKAMPIVIGDVSLIGESWPVGPSRTTKVGIPCGFGPSLTIQGKDYATTVESTRGDLVAGRPATLRTCGEVQVNSGRVAVQALSSGEFSVRSLLLQPTMAAPLDLGSTIEATRWDATSRSLHLGVAEPVDTVFVVRENANLGWSARLADRTLEPLLIDGWAQGWVIPAGMQGTIDLTFEPQQTFRSCLTVGGLAAVVLLVLAAASSRSRRNATQVVPVLDSRPNALGHVLVGTGLIIMAGAAGAVAAAIAWGTFRWRRLAVPTAAGLAAGAVSWTLIAPWPASAATNRDFVSGMLTVTLIGLAAFGCLAPPGSSDPVGPRLGGRLDEAPTESGQDDGDRQREERGAPESPRENLETEGAAHAEHDG